MQSNIYIVIFLVILSALFYALPIIWVNDVNPAAACISSFIALLVLFIYAFYIKNHTMDDINRDLIVKMIISGMCYGMGLLCYIEAIKYNKPILLNLQAIFIFIVSTIVACLILEEKINKCKMFGIGTIITGTALLVYGS